MTENRIWNLVVKMMTHGLSSRNGIVTFLVLNWILVKSIYLTPYEHGAEHDL